MIYLKRFLPTAIILLLTLALAACGNTTTTGNTGSGGSTPAASTASTSTALIKTTTATVNGKSETILTDAQGKALYYFTPDTTTTSACTGGCASNWPPLLASGSSAPTSAASLPGTLTAVTTANGSQIEYNGHLLYTYAADAAPGQVTGQGKGGKWFVATPDLTTGSTTSGSGSGSGSTALIKTASATVGGKSETILTDAKGMTLYYFTPDTATTTACTGGCATNWPPLLSTGSSTPTSATTLSGKLTVVSTANGNQVQYNGHFLYTFAGDSAAGQTKGQGLGGKWFVATPDLK